MISLIWLSYIILAIFIVVLAGCMYGLGENKDDKTSTGYNASMYIGGMSSVFILIAMMYIGYIISKIPKATSGTGSAPLLKMLGQY